MRGRFNGGYIGAQQVTTYGNTKGVYNMVEVQQYVGNTQWPRPPDDFYFNYVVALLHGNGGNPLTSGTPDIVPINKDNSTNNFLLSPNGDVRNDEFHPYQEGYYSNYFDGSGDYLSLTNNTAFDLSSGDFTVETWVYRTGDSGLYYEWIVGKRVQSGGYPWSWSLQVGTNNKFSFHNNVTEVVSTTTAQLNVWYHVAAVRQSGTLKLFVNGVQEATSAAYSITEQNTPLTIGNYPVDNPTFTGYISNLHIVKGTAVYTSNFTPPTAPLTAIANTSLLTCQSNRFIDNSTNRFALTKNGDVSVQYFQPFGQSALNTATYTNNQPSPGTNGYHSVYFDGTGDYLSLTGQNLSSVNWTVECWIYFTSFTTTSPHIWNFGTDANNRFNLWRNGSTGKFSFTTANGPTNYDIKDGTTSPVLNTWYHVAVVSNSGTRTLYVNGIAEVTSTSAINSGTNWSIGALQFSGASSDFTTGYISNFRVATSAVYTSNFTPPTAPLTAIANTSLLTCQSSTLVDNSTNNYAITANGDARVSVAQPFTSTVAGSTVNSYGSMYFDGNGDFLTCAASSALNLTSGDFTIECWIYCPSFVQTSGQIFNKDGVINASYVQYSLQVSNAGALTYYLGNGNGLSPTTTSYSGGTITAGVWFHTAITRTGTTIRTFLNGTQITSTTQGTAMSEGNKPLYIGHSNSGATSDYFSGYISNLRILKGTSLYQANFIPPNMPVTPVTNTSLLTFQNNGPFNNNGFEDGGPFDHIVSRSGDVSQGSFSPYGTNWSNYFDGTGDYLSIPASDSFAFGTGDFTVEAWVYLTATTASRLATNRQGSAALAGTWSLSLSGTTIGFTEVIVGEPGPSATIPSIVNQWTHVVACRQSGTTRLFVNGAQVASASQTTNFSSTANSLVIGSSPTNENFMAGYISNLRIVKGTALYTAAFTPPTAPLTSVVNTSLLTCQSNRLIDNSTNNATITRNGDVSVQRFSPFVPSSVYNAATYGGSAYFDGSSDFVRVTNSSTWSSLSGDFTIECWFYLQNLTASQQVIITQRDSTNPYVPYLIWTGETGTTTTLRMYSSSNNSSWNILNNQTIASGITAGQWYHFAMSRSGGTTFRVFINGVQTYTTTISATYSNTGTFNLGMSPGETNTALTGYVTDARITNRFALYTTNFTPPSSPLTSIANTSVLLSMTNTGIYDNSMLNNFTSVGNVQSTSRLSKYGTGSLYFDGTGDYLYANPPASPLFAFGSGDFTIEFWYYSNDNGVAHTIYDSRPTSTNGAYVYIGKDTTNVIHFYVNSAIRIAGTTTISAGTWYHIAVCRSGSSTKLFVNGIQDGSTYTDTNSYLNGSFRPVIASSGFTVPSNVVNGYIDDLRVTRFARYTANFQPPLYQYNDR